ncbi:MAG: TRCF domain-containing protein [Geminicoccaceae bacterium]
MLAHQIDIRSPVVFQQAEEAREGDAALAMLARLVDTEGTDRLMSVIGAGVQLGQQLQCRLQRAGQSADRRLPCTRECRGMLRVTGVSRIGENALGEPVLLLPDQGRQSLHRPSRKTGSDHRRRERADASIPGRGTRLSTPRSASRCWIGQWAGGGMTAGNLVPDWAPGTLAEPPAGLLALWLAAWAEEQEASFIVVLRDDRRAQELATGLRSLAPSLRVVHLQAWDCMPYDRLQPSRAVMGHQVAAVQELARTAERNVVVTTPSGLGQRVPPPASLAQLQIDITVGTPLDREGLARFLQRSGYIADERVDEPDEMALRGSVPELFPAAAELPVRIETGDDRIVSIRRYDPLTQRSVEEIDRISVRPASEAAEIDDEGPPDDLHALAGLRRDLTMLFDCLPDARIVFDGDAEARFDAWTDLVAEAFAARRALMRAEAASGEVRVLMDPEGLHLTREEWSEALAGRPILRLERGAGAATDNVIRSRARLTNSVRQLLADERLVVLAGANEVGASLATRLGIEPVRAADWRRIVDLTPGRLALLAGPCAGFATDVLTVIDATGIGARGRPQPQTAKVLVTAMEMHPGDRVVHLDYGIAELVGLETVEGDPQAGEHVVLRFAGDRRLLIPVTELDRVWRYGSADADVSLDRLDGVVWRNRRDEVVSELEDTAGALADIAAERAEAGGAKLTRPKGYERFVRRFPHEPSEDQSATIDAVLADLARGAPPMDRLICGDVGFSKTEVALRAAAIAALNGFPVAVLAPTTLLVGQHLETFRRRFAGFDLRVEQLSRLGGERQMRKVREGLADGSIHIVVGTHTLASRKLEFQNLGLIVIDEEQRFGTKQKEALARLRRGVHVLTMTATPIPRTLQSALAGVQEISVIATPPQRRQPTRTFVLADDPGVIREGLLRERRRGARSFVVVPRIADLEPMRKRLSAIVPELDIATVHGRMKTADLDRLVLAFADGAHDVLLATSIIEAGLDVPGDDTIMIWHPDRFGVAQLHQLRGRVGRASRRGACYLLHAANEPLPEAVVERLKTLETFDHLGAGFAISARDLDLRGAGALAGDAQAGHLKRIGAGLYEHLLASALRRARGGPAEDDWTPELQLGIDARLSADLVPEPELRLDIYARLARLQDERELNDLTDEIEDRFGEPPSQAVDLLAMTRLRLRCRRLDIARLEAGPKAVAATFRARKPEIADPQLTWSEGRLLLQRASSDRGERLRAAADLLDRIEQSTMSEQVREEFRSVLK